MSSLTICAEKRDVDQNKALSFRDLVVKVRLNRPLLESNIRSPSRGFANTHCFSATYVNKRQHAMIQLLTRNSKKVLTKLQKVAEEVNAATNTEAVRKRIEITWLLQNKLEFNDKVCQ